MKALLLLAAIFCCVIPAQAGIHFTAARSNDRWVPASAGMAAGELALEPHPGARLPVDAVLLDESGHIAPLQQFFTGEPVVLVFEYLRCRTICGLALGSLADALAAVAPASRRTIRVVAIDIDPRDGPAELAAARQQYLTRSGGDSDWHFLSGPEAAVRRIADVAGFHYRYDQATDQYIHAVGQIIATPDGTISSYVGDPGLTPAQLQNALARARRGDIGGAFDRLLLLCFGGAATSGGLSRAILAALGLINLAGALAAILWFARLRRRPSG